jgi:eight-cysteine-cluster-containing protein
MASFANKKIILISTIVLIALLLILITTLSLLNLNKKPITNFQECIDAGNPVMESYPRQCASEGKTFTEELANDPNPSQEYYGSSTFASCNTDSNCSAQGCNAEICGSELEEGFSSICSLPNKPLPRDLQYSCRCIQQKCQWQK